MNYNVFDNIDYNNLFTLYKLCEENNENLTNVKINYSRFNKNLQESLNFLVETDIIKINQNKILLENQKVLFKDIIIKKISKLPQYGIPFKEYVNNFQNINQKLIFKPNPTYNSLTSSLRNFLISMNLIKYNIKENQYELLDEKLITNFDKIGFPPEALEAQLKKQNEIGLLAEEFILNIEKKKLSLIGKNLLPKHISKYDVSAGYDILSYQELDGNIEKIYIEVKAVSNTNFKFYLSEGEYQTSLKYHDNYYLYLLPVDYSIADKFDKDKLIKINNLQKNLFDKNSLWKIENNGYIFNK